jgi:hypothetical protein
MGRQLPYAEIKEVDDNTIEVCYFQRPAKNPHGSWRLSIQEATHIVEWWRYEGRGLTTWHIPIRNRRVGNIMVSMFSPELVCVRTDDTLRRCSLPSNVVRHLADWFFDK